MKSILLHLRELRPSQSPTKHAVIDFLLNHPTEAVELSIHELAAQCFTSASTITRLCHQLGLDGYKSLRRALTREVAIREQDKISYQEEISREDCIESIIEKITYHNMLSLEYTKNLLDPETLNTCVDLLVNCRAVLLFGMGASLCAARDAHLKFLRLDKICMVSDDWHSQYLQARNSRPEDLGIFFSYSGQTVEVIECMKVMKENGTPMIAITRCVDSPVSDLADYKLYTTANEATFRSGAMASRIAQLNIIDILFTALTNRAYEQSVEQLLKTHIQKAPKKRDSV